MILKLIKNLKLKKNGERNLLDGVVANILKQE